MTLPTAPPEPHRAIRRSPAPRPRSSLALAVLLLTAACRPAFVVEEATIAEIHGAMRDGRITAERLVQHYLDRIAAYDKDGPSLNAIITVNALALDRARELDSIYAASGPVGPLHGIPVIVKDNYDTFDMPTTNGILALKHSTPPDDAYHVRRLREAGIDPTARGETIDAAAFVRLAATEA